MSIETSAPPITPKICENCERSVRATQRGRCSACHNYWKRNGIERPKDKPFRNPSIPMRFTKKAKTCITCQKTHYRGFTEVCADCVKEARTRRGRLPKTSPDAACSNCSIKRIETKRAFAWGRCWTCYSYIKRTGKERPKELLEKRDASSTCSNCGQADPSNRYVKSVCSSCYGFKRRKGELPQGKSLEKLIRHRINKREGFQPEACENCDYVRKTKEMRRLVKGLCINCYEYQRRRGNPRPADGNRSAEILKTCVNCGLNKSLRAEGRCEMCWIHYRDHGVDIAPEVRIQRARTIAIKDVISEDCCRSCDVPVSETKKKKLIRGWCPMCYQIAYVKGFDKKGTPFSKRNPIAALLKREIQKGRLSKEDVKNALTKDLLPLLEELEIVKSV